MHMTKMKRFYFPDSKEIASLEGLTLLCPKITNQYSHWHRDARFYGLKTIISHCVSDIIYFRLALKTGSHDPVFGANYCSDSMKLVM